MVIRFRHALRPMPIGIPNVTYRGVVCALLASLVTLVILVDPGRTEETPQVDFRRDVLPVLSENCFACHGPDAEHRESDLRLDVESAAKEYAIVPGSPDESELVARITNDDPDMRMPPPKTGKALTAEQIALLKRWIEQGAPWAQHWAFVPPTRPEVPVREDTDWPRNEIDYFVLRRFDAEGLEPSPPASRAEWLRRVSFDLVGLPPTPEEVAAFVADTSADAHEKVVDRLLQSPHYGERLAIEWLDVARYADTNGYQNDFNRSMWPWRDWVIQAFNDNMPYNQFIIEQIAGDLLPNPSLSQLIATGFNRNHRTVTEAGSIDEEWRVENVVDRVETTAAAFLGLTLGCARCHDHKYDPISQRDFYRFFAFFNNVDEQGVYTETRGNVPPLVPVPTDEDRQRLANFDRRIAEIETKMREARVDAGELFKQLQAETSKESDVESPVAVLSLFQEGQIGVTSAEGARTGSSGASDPAGELTTFVGGAAKWVDGPVGTGLEFMGAAESHVTCADAFAVDTAAPAAWTLWVRADGPGALISKMNDAQAFRGFDTILLEDMRLKVHLIDTWPDNAIAVTSKQPLPRDAWFHLAVSYDGSGRAEGISVWLDGQPVELKLERNTLQGSLETDEPLRVGRRSSGLYFDGAVARLQFFRQPLTTDVVDRLRRQQLVARHGSGDAATQLPQVVQDYLLRVEGHDVQRELKEVREQRAEFEKSMQTVMIMRDRAEYRPTYVLRRGQYDLPQTSEPLWPEIPEFLGQLPSDAPRNRLGLAQWLVDPAHPLVARVAVNRVWQRMFGRGLVATQDNFGVQGEQPTHPELLDWLAVRFVESGWNIKELHKLIALSATYGQSSAGTAELVARNPNNQLLARGPRHRLPAELVRDNALAVSGLLSHKIGGPSVKPYQPDGLWDELAGGANGGPYVMDKDEDLYRRSLYTFRKRTVSHPTLATFDAPSWEICQAKRACTNTPLQALALLNDTTYVEAARHLALRMIREGGDHLRDQLVRGFQLTTQREPTDDELRTLMNGYEYYLNFYTSQTEARDKLLSEGVSQVADEEKTADLAAMATVASILLNLDETITKH